MLYLLLLQIKGSSIDISAIFEIGKFRKEGECFKDCLIRFKSLLA